MESVNKIDKKLIPPGIEPGTLSVLDSRDNRYTMESVVSYKPSLLHPSYPPFTCSSAKRTQWDHEKLRR